MHHQQKILDPPLIHASFMERGTYCPICRFFLWNNIEIWFTFPIAAEHCSDKRLCNSLFFLLEKTVKKCSAKIGALQILQKYLSKSPFSVKLWVLNSTLISITGVFKDFTENLRTTVKQYTSERLLFVCYLLVYFIVATFVELFNLKLSYLLKNHILVSEFLFFISKCVIKGRDYLLGHNLTYFYLAYP